MINFRSASFTGLLLFFAPLYASAKTPSGNAYQDRGLDREGAAVKKYKLTRIPDIAALKRMIRQGHIVRVPDKGDGFILDRRIGSNEPKRANQAYFRYARPFTARFLKRLGHQYAQKFKRRFVITSLVRTCDYQNRLARTNDNAANCRQTSHTTGATFDMRYGSMPKANISWLTLAFLELESKHLLQATKEQGQPVFHVMVYPPYMRYKLKNKR